MTNITTAKFGMKKIDTRGKVSGKMKSLFKMVPIGAKGDVGSLSDNFDIIIISGLTEVLSAKSIAKLNEFYAKGGNVLWIYDEQFQSIITDFTIDLTFQLLEDIEGFNRIPLINNSLYDDFITYGPLNFIYDGEFRLYYQAYPLSFVVLDDYIYLACHEVPSPRPHDYVTIYKKQKDAISWSLCHSFSAMGTLSGDIYKFGNILLARIWITGNPPPYYSYTNKFYSSTDGITWSAELSSFWFGHIAGRSIGYAYIIASIEFNNKFYTAWSYVDLTNWPITYYGSKILSTDDIITWNEEYTTLTLNYVRGFGIYNNKIYSFHINSTTNVCTIYNSIGNGSWSVVDTINNINNSFIKTLYYKGKLYIALHGLSYQVYVYSYDETNLTLETTISNVYIGNFLIKDGILYFILTTTYPYNFKFYSTINGTIWNLETPILDPTLDLGFDGLYGMSNAVLNGKFYLSGTKTTYPSFVKTYVYTADSIADVVSNSSQLQLTWPNKGTDLYNPDHGNSYLMSWHNNEQFISLLTAFETLGRVVVISDSNMFTNSAPDFDTNNNALLVRNILRYIGWWDGSAITKLRVLWLVNSWTAPKLGWMDLDSNEIWGASLLKSFMEAMGYTITQVKDNINIYLSQF